MRSTFLLGACEGPKMCALLLPPSAVNSGKENGKYNNSFWVVFPGNARDLVSDVMPHGFFLQGLSFMSSAQSCCQMHHIQVEKNILRRRIFHILV